MAANPNEFPISPQITPSLAVAGFVLVFTGLAYLLIGIKSKRLNVFFSSGYLVSLAVTVVVISVITPPVSNTVQGAYLVAIVISGIILGAASLLISDMTEGLGCLLGGFCVTMWILVMKPGGLIEDTASKDIFIAVLTVAAFTLFFSRWTKNYALIGLTSFAGATIIILGVDCYSRAGLKEFWLYIWTLNPKLFPATINTYPITRGMRAQIALIFVLFIGGLIAQSKAWKAVKERRQEQRVRLLETEGRRNQVEEDLGRMLEEGNNGERVYWEAAYGERRDEMSRVANAENLTRSPPYSSLSVAMTRESGPPTESFELAPLTFTRDGARDTNNETASASILKVVAHHQTTDEDQHFHSQRPSISSVNEIRLTQDASDLALTSSLDIAKRKPIPNGLRRESPDGGIPRSRPTSPLTPHHNIPSEINHDEIEIETRTQPIAKQTIQSRSLSKLSLKPTSKKPTAASWRAALESEDVLPAPEVDLGCYFSPAITVAINDDARDNIALDEYAETNDWPAPAEVFGESTGGDIPKRLRSDSKDTTTLKEWLGRSRSRAFSDEGMSDPVDASKVPRLSSQATKVATARQPNQSAEHLSLAEKIHIDGLRAASITEDDIQEGKQSTASDMNGERIHEDARPQVPTQEFETTTHATSHKVETNRPTLNCSSSLVSSHQKSSPALVPPKGQADSQCLRSAGPLPSPSLVTQDHHDRYPLHFGQSQVGPAVDEGLDAMYPSPPASVRHFSYPGRPMLSPRLTRAKSSTSVRATSQSSSASSTYSYDTAYSFRGSSSKALHPPPTVSVRNFSYPSPPASVRHVSCPGPTTVTPDNTRIKRYPSTRNTTRSHPESSICFSDASYLHHGLASDVDDTMPLSTRRSIIQSQRRAASYDIPRLSSNNQFFDSHQPQQFSSYDPRKHDAMLAEWRASLRWDQAIGSSPRFPRAAPGRISVERSPVQKLEWKQKSLMEKYRDEVMERAMINGELEEMHREAMRRMQALANMRV